LIIIKTTICQFTEMIKSHLLGKNQMNPVVILILRKTSMLTLKIFTKVKTNNYTGRPLERPETTIKGPQI
jgi:hypothetical protein